MKKIVFLASFLCALLTFAATPEEIAKTRLQYRQFVLARFNHATEISGYTELTAEKIQKLEAAADEFSAAVCAVYDEYHLTDALIKVYGSPEYKELHQALLKTGNRTDYLEATRKLNAYIGSQNPAFDDSVMALKTQDCARQFLKTVETLRDNFKLNEKTEYTFWMKVLFPYAD